MVVSAEKKNQVGKTLCREKNEGERVPTLVGQGSRVVCSFRLARKVLCEVKFDSRFEERKVSHVT